MIFSLVKETREGLPAHQNPPSGLRQTEREQHRIDHIEQTTLMNRTTRAEAATHSAFTASCHPPSKSLNDSNKHSSFHQSPDESILTDTRLPPFDRLRTPLHDPCHSLPAHPAHGHRCNNKRRQQMMKQSQPTPDIRQSACCCPHLFILFPRSISRGHNLAKRQIKPSSLRKTQ